MTNQQPAPITDAELSRKKAEHIFRTMYLCEPVTVADFERVTEITGVVDSTLRAERARADKAQALICAIKDAHVTDEEGDNLVDVCRNAHQSEFEHAHLPAPCQIDGCQYKKLEAQLAEADAVIAIYHGHRWIQVKSQAVVTGESLARHQARAARKESDNG